PDCLQITGTLQISDQVTAMAQQWCRGRGIVSATRTDPDGVHISWEPADLHPEAVQTADAERDGGSPADWRLDSRIPVTRLPGRDPEPMNGAAGIQPPRLTASGQVVLSTRADIIVAEPAGDQQLQA